MIELTVKIDDVDYASLAELLLPALEKEAESADMLWAKLLLLGKGMSVSAAQSILKRMPQEKKDALAVKYINSNSVEIARKLEMTAAKNGFSLSIREIDAE